MVHVDGVEVMEAVAQTSVVSHMVIIHVLIAMAPHLETSLLTHVGTVVETTAHVQISVEL